MAVCNSLSRYNHPEKAMQSKRLLMLVMLAMLVVSACTITSIASTSLPTATAASTAKPAMLATPTATMLVMLATPTPAITSTEPMLAIVTSTGLRVRSCPSLDCRTVDWLKHGDLVTVGRCASGWAYLPTLKGYSRSVYLEPDYCK
jgi:hypothetical protein